MTLGGRNSFLFIATILVLLAVVGWAVATVELVDGRSISLPLDLDHEGSWVFVSWTAQPLNTEWALVTLAGIGVYAVFGGHVLRRYFRRTSATEVFFFTVFVLSTAFDLAKLGSVAVYLLDAPRTITLVVSRFVHFGRLFGLFALFFAGFYAAGVEYQKHGIVLLVSLGLAFGIAAVVPLDTVRPASSLVFPVDGEIGYRTIVSVLYLLIPANFIYGSAKRTPELLAPTVCVVAVIVGRELLFLMVSPLSIIVGGALLVLGTFFFGNRYHHLYLWS